MSTASHSPRPNLLCRPPPQQPAKSSTVLLRRQRNGALGLGVIMSPVAPAVIEAFGPLNSVVEPGATAHEIPVIHSIDPTSPLARALLPGDHIVAIGIVETAGRAMNDVFALLAAAPDNSPITIVRTGDAPAEFGTASPFLTSTPSYDTALNVNKLSKVERTEVNRRAGAIVAATPKAGGPAPPVFQAPADARPIAPGETAKTMLVRGPTGLFGVDFVEQPVAEGISVRTISPASPAGLLGVLRPGDVITAIDGAPLAGLSVPDAIAHVRGKQFVELTLVRPLPTARPKSARPKAGVKSRNGRGASPPPIFAPAPDDDAPVAARVASPRAVVLRPTALELPHLECGPHDAHLNSTWGQRMSALRSLPAQLYVRDDEWWLPREAAPRDALDLLDAGLAHVATGGLPCRQAVFAKLMLEVTPRVLSADYLRPLFEEAATRSRPTSAAGDASVIFLTGETGYFARAAFPSFRPFLELVRDWVLRCDASSPPPEVHTLSWPQFEAFFTAWHEAFGAAELAWLVSALYPPRAAHGEADPLLSAAAPSALAAMRGGLAYLASDIETWMEACASLAGDIWVIDGVEVLLPTAMGGTDGLAASAAAIVSAAHPDEGRSAAWYELTLGARHAIVSALATARPASPHAVFVLGRGLERAEHGGAVRPPPVIRSAAELAAEEKVRLETAALEARVKEHAAAAQRERAAAAAAAAPPAAPSPPPAAEHRQQIGPASLAAAVENAEPAVGVEVPAKKRKQKKRAAERRVPGGAEDDDEYYGEWAGGSKLSMSVVFPGVFVF